MTVYLPLRSGPSGAAFVGTADNDTVLWDQARQRWFVGPGGGVGGVSSFNARTGAVVPLAGDYDSDQVDNLSAVTGASVSDALDALLAALGVAGLKRAPDLGNADSTISLTAGSLFVLPAGTNNANRTYTLDRNGLPTSTPGTGSAIYVLCMDTTAFTKAFVNGGAGAGTMVTLAASQAACLLMFVDDGTNWNWPPYQALVEAI